jgi:hypothetical protein
MKLLLPILLVVGFAVGYNALLVKSGPTVHKAIVDRLPPKAIKR